MLPSGAELDEDRTAVPLELDQIYSSIDDLTVALGPTGANKNGALTDLLESTAKNFGGQGEKFHQTIEDFSRLSATLDDNKEELFGSAAELEGFINTLAENDQTVRTFNQSLADVSTMLAGERTELAASLKNLAVAMTEVSSFVRDNREILGKNIRGLNRVSKVLVKQRSSLDEILRRPGRPEQPLPHLQPAVGHARHPGGRPGPARPADRGGPRCLPLLGREPGRPERGRACNQIEDALPQAEGAASQLGQILPRTATFGRAGGRPAAVAGPLRPSRWVGSWRCRDEAAQGTAAGPGRLPAADRLRVRRLQLPLPGGTDTGNDPMTVQVVFADVLDLVPKSTVKVNDVSVGQVTDIGLSGSNAQVTLELRNDIELPANAIAEIRQTSLLGEKFVQPGRRPKEPTTRRSPTAT